MSVSYNTYTNPVAKPIFAVNRGLSFLAPIADLLIRCWVAWIFFRSGLTKIQSMDSTITLFKYEYNVPLLEAEVAAYIGTWSELILPVLLAVGLAGRYTAVALFIFNIAAVISYPDMNPAGVRQHQAWGIMLLIIIGHGPGKISLDYLIERFFRR